jgi:hypothetical protein
MAFLGGLCLALLAACLFLTWELANASQGVFYGEEALRDPEIQRQVVERLAQASTNPFDSHPDGAVGRVLIPNGERGEFRTNAYGLRERDYALPKPADVVRIVLLGDSFVFGLNIEARERLGARLEEALSARVPGRRFECLHLAVNSWNLRSECVYLRRQLHELAPDLVIQVSYSNDLDDVTGVRGFGAEAAFVPYHRERADSLILDRFAQSYLGQDTRNLLSRGLDHESRTRFAEALAEIERLRALLAEMTGAPRYLLVLHWGFLAPVVHEQLGSRLPEGSVLYVPPEVAADKGLWITPNDPHWNPEAHALVAGALYGAIRERALLPAVELPPWPEAEQRASEWSERGRAFASTGGARVREMLGSLVSVLDWPDVTLEEARQVHGGLDLEGLVSPYASCALRRPAGASALHVRGRSLPDPALRGAKTRVFLEELEVGTLVHAPDAALELDVPIPPALDGRELLGLRFESDDYVYRGADLRHCVVFRLERAALE